MSETSSPFFYRLAGQTIAFDRDVPELLPFRSGPGFQARFLSDDPQLMAENPPLVQATGWLAEKISKISLWRDDRGYLVDIPDAGRFWTAADGSAICQVAHAADTNPAYQAESLLGPPLMLALAVRGIWCLHASAVEYNDQWIGFLGRSGSGKSTLAAYLASQPGVHHVSDDILPVCMNGSGLFALPHFPQLKLPIERQPGPKVAEKHHLAGLYLLEELPAVSISAFNPVDAALRLIAHTAAARLFDEQVLEQHLTFCSLAAAGLPVFSLAYPRSLVELPRVWDLLKDQISNLNV